jgi:hypothetical protein
MSTRPPAKLPSDWKDRLVRSEPKDITAQASKMPPGFGVLYQPAARVDNDPPDFIGVLRAKTPGLFWVTARFRSVNGKLVLELQFRPKA